VINNNPISSFTYSSDSLCAGTPIRFSGSASPDASSWLWDFGNGTGTDAPPFSRIYASAGSYPVTGSVTTAAGCGSLPQRELLRIAESPTAEAGPDLYLQTGEQLMLQASISNPQLYNFSWTPVDFLSNPTVLNPFTRTEDSITYRLLVTDKVNGCTSTDSMKVLVLDGMYIPNAFTPNADGLNDTWGIPFLVLYPEAEVMVYNRFGQNVYRSTGYGRPWNGQFKGQPLPSGSYVYLINLNTKDGKLMKGTVTILR
jgi:gliding motility-associated-like protein